VSSGLPIRFEPARLEHVEIFVPMMRALEDADPGTTAFDERRRRAIFEDFVKEAAFGRAWLIFEGEKLAGYVILTLGFSFEYRGRDGYIDELYLDAQFRGRGIGRKTMEFVERAARELGLNAIHLEATGENTAAIELYRRVGFVDHERRLMTKWLTQQAET
jgi:ribosomal protein S18 acetylase RimI-like enzyme